MGLFELCLLSSLAPQQPAPKVADAAPVATTATAVAGDPARWLPTGCLAAVTYQSRATAAEPWSALLATDPTGALAAVGDQVQAHLAATGLAAADLADLQSGGIALGLVGFGTRHEPRLVLVAAAPTRSNAIAATLDRAAVAPGKPESQRADAGRAARTLRIAGQTCSGGIFGTHLVIATDAQLVAATAAQLGTGQGGLATATDYPSPAADATDAPAVQLLLFARPAGLLQALLAMQPAGAQPNQAAIVAQLGLEQLGASHLRLSSRGRQIVGSGALGVPSGRNLWNALLGDAARLTPKLAALVPASATEFTLSTVDLGAVAERAFALAGSLQPEIGQVITTTIDNLTKQTRSDIRNDLLRGFAGQIVGVRFASGQGVMFGLRDGARFQRALQGICKATGTRLERTTVAGVAADRLAPSADSPLPPLLLATFGNWLCVADDTSSLATMLGQIEAGTADAGAAALLREAPTGTALVQGSRTPGDRLFVGQRDDRIVLDFAADLQQFGAALAEAGARPLPQEPTAPAPTPSAPSKPQPNAQSKATPPTATAAASTAPASDLEALQRLERDGKKANLAAAAALAASNDAAVASRATWLLSQIEDPNQPEALHELATKAPQADARLQAMAALLRQGQVRSVATATTGLDDPDRRVRAVAAQVLGKLRRPTSVAPLLALLDRRAPEDHGATPAIDVQAAILALHDLGAKDQLLATATAVQNGKVAGCGQALAFTFQDLSPQCAPKDELALLLAVLDHREPLLRRYAIGRLGELGDATAASALERRLGSEGAELRPLVEVALARVRKQAHGTESQATEAAADGPLQAVQQRWAGLTPPQQFILVGFGCLFVLAIGFVVIMVRRRSASVLSGTTTAVTDLVAPSDEYVAELAAEAEQIAAEAETIELDEPHGGDTLLPGEETAWAASVPDRDGTSRRGSNQPD